MGPIPVKIKSKAIDGILIDEEHVQTAGREKVNKWVVSHKTLMICVTISMLLSFLAGRALRNIIHQPRTFVQATAPSAKKRLEQDNETDDGPTIQKVASLPPIEWDSKMMMPTLYSSKYFSNPNIKSSFDSHAEFFCDASIASNSFRGGNEQEIDIDRSTTGEHLLLDIKHVDSDFLDDEERLSQALVDVCSDAKLALISYHCHSMVPSGVTCVGVLTRGHISFHTWPDDGVILMDLYISKSSSLDDQTILPVLSNLERLFAVPDRQSGTARTKTVSMPRVEWRHKLRGFSDDHFDSNPLGNDLGDEVLESWMEYKTEVRVNVHFVTTYEYTRTSFLSHNIIRVITQIFFSQTFESYITEKQILSTKTKYQRVDIYDSIPASQSLYIGSDTTLDQAVEAGVVVPERSLFLDGVVQSKFKKDEAYHEALVHPAMLTHPNPKRVAIIGGGEGATLREVLKHRTVEHVTMIEIDEDLVGICREYLPGMSDCSDIDDGSSTKSCFDDSRVELIFEDANDWFIDNFGPDDDDDDKEDYVDVEEFDVIIMDALDPTFAVPKFSDGLYSDEGFMPSFFKALTEEGIAVIQMGISPAEKDPDEHMGPYQKRSEVIQHVAEFADSMHMYEEGNCGFGFPWSFLVACINDSCSESFHRNEAELEISMHRRLLKSRSGLMPLKFFDGATMKSYQVPPKSWETVHCRQTPMPEECGTRYDFDPNTPNFPSSIFDVKTSSLGEHVGRGVFATVDIPQGALIGQELAGNEVQFSPRSVEIIENMMEAYEGNTSTSCLYNYFEGYGFEFYPHGGE